MTTLPLRNTCLALIALLALGACTMTTPSQVRTGQMVVEETPAVLTRTLHDMTRADAVLLAKGYKNRGRGEMSATVSYDGADSAALAATRKEIARVARDLQAEGVNRLQVEYVPVRDAALKGQVVFTYAALNARAPDHCSRMPGYQGGEDLIAIRQYQISCESKSIMSQMIVRPEDLLGRDGKGGGTSRREAATVELYQDGEPNELFSEVGNASEVSQ